MKREILIEKNRRKETDFIGLIKPMKKTKPMKIKTNGIKQKKIRLKELLRWRNMTTLNII